MRIIVCVKLVNKELSPFDACALEYALRFKDSDPDTDLTIICMGRPDCLSTLQALTRLGVPRAVLLSDNIFAGADTLATAYTLSLAIKKLMPDLILCGRQSIDGDTAQTGPALAALLEIPVITNVLEMFIEVGKGMRCITRFGEEKASFPMVLTMERTVELRFPRINSKLGIAELWDAAKLEADPERCGLKGSPTRVLKTYECHTDRRHCRFIQLEQLDEVIESVIKKPQEIRKEKAYIRIKLPEIWCVGTEPLEWAHRIAERVHVLEKDTPNCLAARIRQKNPSVVLWDGGLWGRRTAPQVAALLHTGLCADCTTLETDGDTLYMTRPAFGGNLLATISCRTRPQMATMRPSYPLGDQVIVGVGVGVATQFVQIQKWANQKGYGLAVSRPLVDRGLAPYELQVGLTGRTVRPAVYIAIGISGAVQHTCAIEQAGTIIAINPDKNARIFDCANLGICDTFRSVL